MTGHRDPSPRLVFLLLTATRWAPVGLVVGIFALVARERGLSPAETLSYTAFQGLAVLLVELPSSAVADAMGRRPLLVLAGVVNVVTAGVYLVAHSFWQFALAATLMGVYRALDSGPLEAWYVDRAHADDPQADVASDLAAQGTVLGVTIAAGSLLSGALVAWHPWRSTSPLLLPLVLYAVLCAAHLLATVVLLREPRRARTGPSPRGRDLWRATPRVVADGLRLVRRDGVLAGVLAVELAWCAALVVFEQVYPLRLAELLGGPDVAGRWVGPVSAAGWGAFAVFSALAGRLQARLGVVPTALLARVLNGLAAAAMGLVAGPAALVGTYLLTYGLHGMQGVAHNALLHERATSSTRATVLSLNSLVFFAAASAWGPLLGLVSGRWGLATAMVLGGLVSVLGLVGYLPALRARHAPARS